ncbi:MAG: type II secretion system protein [Vulcanimicrobiota bacterium]
MKKRGFTLIELMIVIAIISILASIIIPNITRARARAQLTACMENMKALATALHMGLADQRLHDGSNEFSCTTDDTSHEFMANYVGKAVYCPAGDSYWVNAGTCGDNRFIYTHHSNGGAHRDIMLDITNGDCDWAPIYRECFNKDWSRIGWCPEELN